MSDEESAGPGVTFFLSTFGFAMAAFPLMTTLNDVVFDGGLGGPAVIGGSVVVAVPVGVEYVFSGRDPYLVGRFVGAFALLFLATVVGRAVAAGAGLGTVPAAARIGLLLGAYVVAYVLVYRGLARRIRHELNE